MRWRPSSFINVVLIVLRSATTSVLGVDVPSVSNDQVVFFALQMDGLDYDKLQTSPAMESAIRTNIAQAIATEVGKGVAANDVVTELSKGASSDGSGVGSVLAEIWVTPPDGVDPAAIRDALLESSKLGDSVASGIDSVYTGIGMKAAGAKSANVKPFTVPVLKDRDQGLSFTMMALLAVGGLSMLGAFLFYMLMPSLSKARTKLFGPTGEEESRARRGNILICCGSTKKDYKMVDNPDEGGWTGRSRAAW